MNAWVKDWNHRRNAKYNMSILFPVGRRGRKPGKPAPASIPWDRSKAQTARRILEGLGEISY